MIKPQIIEQDGKAAFAVLRYEDWRKIEEMLEDSQDAAAAEAFHRSAEETFPIALADEILAGANPVRIYRKHRGFTQAKLSEASGISIPYLSQIEDGKRNASLDVMKRLAAALGVSVDELS